MTSDLGVYQYEGGFGGGGGGGGGTPVGAAKSVSLASGISSKSVTFTTAFVSLPVVNFSFQNTTDTNPIFLQGYISVISDSGFTVVFNTSTDTANYLMNYTASVAT